jgi:hypothetical protein
VANNNLDLDLYILVFLSAFEGSFERKWSEYTQVLLFKYILILCSLLCNIGLLMLERSNAPC